jgi:hypothetical protein
MNQNILTTIGLVRKINIYDSILYFLTLDLYAQCCVHVTTGLRLVAEETNPLLYVRPVGEILDAWISRFQRAHRLQYIPILYTSHHRFLLSLQSLRYLDDRYSVKKAKGLSLCYCKCICITLSMPTSLSILDLTLVSSNSDLCMTLIAKN